MRWARSLSQGRLSKRGGICDFFWTKQWEEAQGDSAALAARCSISPTSDLRGSRFGQAYVAKYFPPENKARMLADGCGLESIRG